MNRLKFDFKIKAVVLLRLHRPSEMSIGTTLTLFDPDQWLKESFDLADATDMREESTASTAATSAAAN